MGTIELSSYSAVAAFSIGITAYIESLLKGTKYEKFPRQIIVLLTAIALTLFANLCLHTLNDTNIWTMIWKGAVTALMSSGAYTWVKNIGQ